MEIGDSRSPKEAPRRSAGPNGSGKTRLAAHIEQQLGLNAHRISAHRALSLNPGVRKISETEALRSLRTGYAQNRSSEECRQSGGLEHSAYRQSRVRPGPRTLGEAYSAGIFARSRFTDITRFSTYVISILHHVVNSEPD